MQSVLMQRVSTAPAKSSFNRALPGASHVYRRPFTAIAAGKKKPPSSTAGVGFAPPSSKKDSKTKRKGYEPEMDKGWFHVADAADFGEKQTKSVIMSGNQQALVLYKVGEELYCSDAESTAFRFPLSDAKIVSAGGDPQIETPLDGTIYKLKTGEVVKWCPQNNPVRFVLGALKKKEAPKALKMYDAREDDEGRVLVRLD
mmetsp:Transcript_4240/g.12218  ORF Transcript_4240/g.12218 Transcript_4240/m.12218 type:complete len:200 (+) Transcript_4240:185-784(+)